jgi:hypothetical protein
MSEEKNLRDVGLRQLLSWTDLFRSFQIALDPSKLLLAAAAIVVLTFGWWLLSLIFGVGNQFGDWPPNSPRGANPYLVVTERRGALLSPEFWLGEMGRRQEPSPLGAEEAKAGEPNPSTPAPDKQNTPSAPATPPEGQASLVAEIYSQPPVHLEPFHKFLAPVTILLKHNPTDRQWWYCLFGVLMTVAIWGIAGGAITRIAAVQFARGEKVSVWDALRFSVKRFVSYFSAPLIPFGGVAVVTLFMIVGGLLFHIPWLGEVAAGLLWFLAMAGGMAMAFILIGLVGWPLMYATISTEGSDSFDALSRSYSYVFQRPWHYLFYSIVAMLYGVLVIFFVVFVTSFMVYLSKWAVSLTPALWWRATGDPVSASFYFAPKSYDWQRLLMQDHPLIREVDEQSLLRELEGTDDPAERRTRIQRFLKGKGVGPEAIAQVLASSGRQREQILFEIGRERVWQQMNKAQVLGAAVVAVWLHALFLVMLGFAYSYFWSVSTIIYFLLRKRVDDTDLDEVYLEDAEEEAYPTPVTPAPSGTSRSTESERSAESPRATPQAFTDRPSASATSTTDAGPGQGPDRSPSQAPERSEEEQQSP